MDRFTVRLELDQIKETFTAFCRKQADRNKRGSRNVIPIRWYKRKPSRFGILWKIHGRDGGKWFVVAWFQVASISQRILAKWKCKDYQSDHICRVGKAKQRASSSPWNISCCWGILQIMKKWRMQKISAHHVVLISRSIQPLTNSSVRQLGSTY